MGDNRQSMRTTLVCVVALSFLCCLCNTKSVDVIVDVNDFDDDNNNLGDEIVLPQINPVVSPPQTDELLVPQTLLATETSFSANYSRFANSSSATAPRACVRDAQGRVCSENGECVKGVCQCHTGYIPPLCEGAPCPRDCSGHGVCVAGTCRCNKGWTRSDCSVDTCPNQCSHQGSCVDGVCECWKGWTSQDCSVDSCPNHCSQRGNCSQGTCVCFKGWKGESCDMDTCPMHCSGRGVCHEGTCQCDGKWSGADCTKNPCPGQCSGRGRCNQDTEECDCDLGWRGDACDKPVCPNDCFATQHQGVCVWANEPGTPPHAYCSCLQGFKGIDCSETTCPNNCSNRGACVKGECVCDSGVSSLDCSPLSCANHCSFHGTCNNGMCACDIGWRGDDCAQDTCPSSCHDRGYCVDGKCQCFSPYTGDDCSKDSCEGKCSGHGRCDAGTCECFPGWEGQSCNTSVCVNTCSGHGTCDVDSRKCVCWFGWRREDCSAEVCVGMNECSQRGECKAGACVCEEGWTGNDCSKDTCLNHCSGNGECERGECRCYPGWVGTTCQVRANSIQDENSDPPVISEDSPDSPPPHSDDQQQYVEGMIRKTSSEQGVEIFDSKFDDYVSAKLHACPNFCGANGACVRGVCVCDAGWAGADCTRPMCPPYPSSGFDMSRAGYVPHGYSDLEYFPCNGNGDCVTGICQCYLGWSGDDCSKIQSRGFTGPAPDINRRMPGIQPEGALSILEQVSCEGDALVLECPTVDNNNQVLIIDAAMYGRDNPRDCLINGLMSRSGKFNISCFAPNVLQAVRRECQGKRKCQILVYANAFRFANNSCPDIYRYLKVNYACVNDTEHKASEPVVVASPIHEQQRSPSRLPSPAPSASASPVPPPMPIPDTSNTDGTLTSNQTAISNIPDTSTGESGSKHSRLVGKDVVGSTATTKQKENIDVSNEKTEQMKGSDYSAKNNEHAKETQMNHRTSETKRNKIDEQLLVQVGDASRSGGRTLEKMKNRLGALKMC